MTRRFSNIIIVLLAGLATLVGCVPKSGKKQDAGNVITVSIPPLYGLVQEIVGNDFTVQVLLPEGSTPETYSPTIGQISAVQESEFLFTCNLLEFEKVVTKRLEENRKISIVNISEGCKIIDNQCDTNCKDGENQLCKHSEEAHRHHSHHHHGGVDPHVWMSPFELETMANNIGRAICNAYPDSAKYVANFERLIGKLQERQTRYAEQLQGAGSRVFLIYHPALSYLARDYDLVQVALENEGKNPTPSTLAGVMETVNKHQIGQMMYQAEYPWDTIKPIIDILGVNAVQINPLNKDIISELDKVINTISTTK